MAIMIKHEWFNNNEDAVRLFQDLCGLADVWDNLIDKDKPVSNKEINELFITCLFRLPMNPIYHALELQIAPMWLTVISAYETANHFEDVKDEHGIELGHVLRYAAGHIISYVIIHCVGIDKSRQYIPEMWKNLANERFEEYRGEHIDGLRN